MGQRRVPRHEVARDAGVVGFGRVGQQVANGWVASAWTSYVRPVHQQERADQFGAELVDDLEDCLAKSDFIRSTRH